ncbi:MAG TPA: SBBP repeat-containing protein, partial [Solirubrobacterales bacterium]|nr:SBBP repeat-containing protein [Solirubrobacterales bacterium]
GGVEDLAIDAQGNAYVTGSAMSLPVTPGAYQTECTGCSLHRADAFVAKLNPEGTALVYATFLGGSALDRGLGIAVDADGEAYVVGATESTNGVSKPFPTTPGAFQPTGGIDGFVTKLNATGSALVYSSYLGGNVRDQAMSVAVDAAEAAYVTGSTQSSDFPLVAPTQAALGVYGSHDAFLTVVSPTGSSLLFSTYLGGYSRDEGHHVVVDAAGSAAYVTGQTSSADFPTTAGAFQTQQRNQSTEAFVTKFLLEDPPPPPPPAASVTVVTPNAATTWGIGSTWQLKWQHTLGPDSDVRVELSRDGGATWSDIAASVRNTSATAGSLNWVVTGPETAQALIRVSSVDAPGVADVSDRVFKIAAPSVRVTDPNTSSAVWTTGTTATVRWSHNLGGKESVRIELLLDGGISYPIVLASSTSCDGSHPVQVQSGWNTTAARVRVTWLRDGTVTDVSDVNFTIQ